MSYTVTFIYARAYCIADLQTWYIVCIMFYDVIIMFCRLCVCQSWSL